MAQTAIAAHKKLGIEVAAAQAYIDELNIPDGTNGYDLLTKFIRPTVGPKSVCELVLEKGAGGAGEANIFWSHAQAEKVRDTLAGMETYLRNSILVQIYFWVDYFTLKQNAKGEFAPPEVLAVIGKIGHTVMVASPWNAPTTLSRAWCVYKVICTDKVNATFEAHLPPQDASDFVSTISTEASGYLMNVFVDIDIRKCKAYDENDKAMILGKVSELDNGIHGANTRVVATIKRAFLSLLASAIEAQPGHLNLALKGATIFDEHGQVAEAEVICRKALSAAEEGARGLDSVEVGNLSHRLGTILKGKGDLNGAEPLLHRALQIAESVEGLESKKVAAMCMTLGSLLKEKADLNGAEGMHRRSLMIREKECGPESKEVGWSCNNLGSLLHEKGDPDGAEEMYRRSLIIKEKVYGMEHPSVATSCNNLGSVTFTKGDVHGAEEMYRRSLIIREKALGMEHPSVGDTCNNLGHVIWTKGDVHGAEEMYRRSLIIREKTLGMEHPLVGDTCYDIGFCLEDKGDLDGAKEMFRRSLISRENALGMEHLDVAKSCGKLGTLLKDKGDLDGATGMFRGSLKIYEEKYGMEHIETIIARNYLQLITSQAANQEAIEPATQEASPLRCPQGHETKDHFTTGCTCDVCQRTVLGGEHVMQCRQCDWDLCVKCQASLKQAEGEVVRVRIPRAMSALIEPKVGDEPIDDDSTTLASSEAKRCCVAQ